MQDIAVEPYLTVRETISRDAGYYPAPLSVPEVIGLVGLAGLERRKVRTLSGGQKRRPGPGPGPDRCPDPELLFLDEPTTGFDPAARRDAWQLVRQLRAAGTTILLTTHAMDEAQALADRVVLLSGGVVIADGPPAALGGRTPSGCASPSPCRPGDALTDLPLPAEAANGVVLVETGRPTETLHQLTDWRCGAARSWPGSPWTGPAWRTSTCN